MHAFGILIAGGFYKLALSYSEAIFEDNLSMNEGT